MLIYFLLYLAKYLFYSIILLSLELMITFWGNEGGSWGRGDYNTS